MNKYWIVVANASEAKFFATENIRKVDMELQFIQELEHPESRLKRQDLAIREPGSYKVPWALGSAYEQDTDPKYIEKDQFAKEIAHFLYHAKNEHQYERLILIITPGFHGILDYYLNKVVKESILQVIHKNWINLATEDLAHLIYKDLE